MAIAKREGDRQGMVIVASYHVDTALYFSSDTVHTVTLHTTEYTYKNDLLVHLQVGKKLNARLNEVFRHDFRKNESLAGEQYFHKKTYNKGNAKPTTQSTFDDKLSRFDMGKTVIEQEIVEEYAYTGKDGKPDSVQIAVRDKSGTDITATIDFKDMAQHDNFICPAWLTVFGADGV